jgi:hypothetical protein
MLQVLKIHRRMPTSLKATHPKAFLLRHVNVRMKLRARESFSRVPALRLILINLMAPRIQ